MIGEPRFGGWNAEPPPAEQINTKPEQNVEEKSNFDTSRIEYDNEREKERNALNDSMLCERLNSGEKFALVFADHVFDQEGVGGRIDLEYPDLQATQMDHLGRANIVLGDGQSMGYSRLEDAIGLNFSKSMLEDHSSGGNRTSRNFEDRLTVNTAELSKWLHEKFGEQFVGVVETKPEFGDASNEAYENAKSEAMTLIQGDSRPLEEAQ